MYLVPYPWCSTVYKGCTFLAWCSANISTMSFGPGPVILSLSQWTELNLSAIIQATATASALDTIESLLFKDALITINGQTSSRADLAEQLNKARFPGTQAAISFKGAVEVPADAQKPLLAGSVGVFFTAVVKLPEIIRDVPPQEKLTASINVVIAEGESLSKVTPDRKVKELNAVIHLGAVQA